MKNKIIIFTGPSGVGKATIEKALFSNEDLRLELSVSATTRAKRDGEVNGKHYYFISKDDFNNRINNDEFIEYSEHFSNKYGTLKTELARIIAENKNPFLEVETNGAKNLMDKFDTNQYIGIFIAPPSKQALIDRIRARGSETEEQLKERVSRLEEELSYKDLFEHIVINDNIDHAVEEIQNILLKELS